MRPTIISVILTIISILSTVKCDSCGPSHFNTSSGCKECFCSGVTDQCHEGEFYSGITSIDLNRMRGFIVETTGDSLPSWTSVNLQRKDSEFIWNFGTNRRDGFVWNIPFRYNGNRAGMYGGLLKFVHRTRVNPDSEFRLEPFTVYLDGTELGLSSEVTPWDEGRTVSFYHIPLIESSWRVMKDNYPLATKNDMMRTLISLHTIKIETFSNYERESISLWDTVSIDVAVKSPKDTPRVGFIEICDCPGGYTGVSCESCSPGFRRNEYNKIQSVFGACEPHVILPEPDN